MFQKLFVLLTLGLVACDEEKGCTLIGCNSGVTLTFIGPDGESVSNVSGSVGSDMLMSDGIEFDCSGEGIGEDYICDGNSVTIFMEEGDSLYINAGSDPYMVSTELELEWTESTPNGEDCPPVCYNANAEISMERAIESQ